jgi:isopenicillin-N epimerase
MAGQEPGGWPAVMAANHALALEGRDRIARALGVAPPVPDELLGSMATLPLPGVTTNEAAAALHDTLADEDGIEVPINGWPARGARRAPGDPPSRVLVRISAQRYNEPIDYDRLASALRRRLIEA